CGRQPNGFDVHAARRTGDVRTGCIYERYKVKQLPTHNALIISEGVPTTNRQPSHLDSRTPDQASAPVNYFVRLKWRPTFQFNLAMHVQPDRRREWNPACDCMLKVTPRAIWNFVELGRVEGTTARRDRVS